MKKYNKIDEILFLNTMHLYIWLCCSILEIVNFIFWNNDKITFMCLTCHFIILIESIAIILLIRHNNNVILYLYNNLIKDKEVKLNEKNGFNS